MTIRSLVSVAKAAGIGGLYALLLATPASAQPVSFEAEDGVTVHATWYRTQQTATAVILAFHQGGASGEAEYSPIVGRLNGAGYHVLAVDQRAGGDRFDGVNRTVQARGDAAGFCDAAPDLAASLRYARAQHPGIPIVLWGSSYSAALALRLAASGPAGVAGALAFSPASGGPMAECRAEETSDKIRVPVLVLRPEREMAIESAAAQAELFRSQGHQVFVAHPGTHGSSMLVEDRVGAGVEPTWNAVLAFLARVVK